MPASFHEHLEPPETALPSDRSTGIVFVAVALVVAYFWRGNQIVLTAALAVAAGLLLLALFAPAVLAPLNRLWMKFALLLSRVMNPIVMLVLFAVVVVPAGLIMQLFRDPLRRKRPAVASYWVTRPDADKSSMANQF